MTDSSNLNRARRNQRDEFKTRMVDVEDELQHYKQHFVGKTVYCNCDAPDSSFVKYFQDNQAKLGINQVLYSWLNRDTGDGDFPSQQSVELLEQSDVVVTNPPFSLFREHLKQLVDHGKLFLTLGNQLATQYAHTFELLKSGKLWLGVNNGGTKWFQVPDDYSIPTKARMKIVDGKKYISLGSAYWYTNMKHDRTPEPIELTAEYSPELYPTYVGSDVINVDRLVNIPADYYGVMGVPLTIFKRHNPDQFEILGKLGNGAVEINGELKRKYTRILIKRVVNDTPSL